MTVRKTELSPERRQLIERMQTVNFGRIHQLQVRGGEPAFTPMTRVERQIKFGGENRPRPEAGLGDFVLKRNVVELFETFERLAAVRPVFCVNSINHTENSIAHDTGVSSASFAFYANGGVALKPERWRKRKRHSFQHINVVSRLKHGFWPFRPKDHASAEGRPLIASTELILSTWGREKRRSFPAR